MVDQVEDRRECRMEELARICSELLLLRSIANATGEQMLEYMISMAALEAGDAVERARTSKSTD